MKQIILIITLISIIGFLSPLGAQEVTGYYNGKKVYVKYTKGRVEDVIHKIKYDSRELSSILSELANLNAKIAEKDRRIKELEKSNNQTHDSGRNQNRDQNQGVKSDSTNQQIVSLRLEKWQLEHQRDSLQGRVQLLSETVRTMKDTLDKVKKLLEDLTINPPLPDPSQYVGVYYRLGCPWLINKALREDYWSRQITPSHQCGLYWNSAPFSEKLPMTFGVGLEYSWMRFSAGIGHLKDTLRKVMDNDGDDYNAFYTYSNVTENATLQCISLPLSFSIGAPRINRITGYFQVSLIPSYLIANFTASGVYSQAGQYDYIDGNTANLYLDDFSHLGFGSNMTLPQKTDTPLFQFVLSGRVSGGCYIPLCNTAKRMISHWAIKVGVNLETGFFFRKQKDAEHPNAKYHLDQYNIFDTGSRYLNPSLEVGILYIFNH